MRIIGPLLLLRAAVLLVYTARVRRAVVILLHPVVVVIARGRVYPAGSCITIVVAGCPCTIVITIPVAVVHLTAAVIETIVTGIIVNSTAGRATMGCTVGVKAPVGK